MARQWLRDAVFYEIYPQTFFDTNGDGIGDLNGITQKLTYVKSLGCNALWLNPFYDSPFKDAGYDVRDYKKIASRYGTVEDLQNLFREAHKLGIRVLIDLVPGHTSEENAWFRRSSSPVPNEMWDRYIWTDGAFSGGDGMPFIGGEAERNATYIINFFKCQPALNYGYHKINQRWQQPITAPGPMANREAMKDIMRYWLDLGCDGFRVDMADSLVKNDPEKISTMEVWRDIAGAIHQEYPDAALVSEWNTPARALSCGFDMDFYLEWHGNGYSSLMRDYDRDSAGNIVSRDNSYFKADSTRDMSHFLEDYLPQYQASRDKGLWCFITCNHDTFRPAPTLNETERRLAFAFLFTMPGAPFLYYGDEIGMGYRCIPTKEGGFQRTGSRTPMQWDKSKNLGFSQSDEPYLPVDPSPNAPTVADQEKDPDSFLNFVRGIIALRHSQPHLQNYSPFAVYYAPTGSRLFAYRRGDLLLAVNPGLETLTLALEGACTPIYTIGAPTVEGTTLTMPAQSFVVLKPNA